MPKLKMPKQKTPAKACIFCKSDSDDPEEFGQYFTFKKFNVHLFCALFASGLAQNGPEDDEFGFLPEDVLEEVNRASRLRCAYCHRTGATMGCGIKKCQKTYHFPCGLKAGVLNQYFGNFSSYCMNHKPRQENLRRGLKKNAKLVCEICYNSREDIEDGDKDDSYLRAPCCCNKWCHRKCMQKHANSSGYFFKCPFCNNKDVFRDEMLRYGIYVPDRDAAWELAENAFQELREKPPCGAVECLCPLGRKTSRDKTQWQIVHCESCGGDARHLGCANLSRTTKSWKCAVCVEFEESLMKRKKEQSDEKRSKCEQKPTKQKILLTSHSRVLRSRVNNSNCSENNLESHSSMDREEVVPPVCDSEEEEEDVLLANKRILRSHVKNSDCSENNLKNCNSNINREEVVPPACDSEDDDVQLSTLRIRNRVNNSDCSENNLKNCNSNMDREEVVPPACDSEDDDVPLGTLRIRNRVNNSDCSENNPKNCDSNMNREEVVSPACDSEEDDIPLGNLRILRSHANNLIGNCNSSSNIGGSSTSSHSPNPKSDLHMEEVLKICYDSYEDEEVDVITLDSPNPAREDLPNPIESTSPATEGPSKPATEDFQNLADEPEIIECNVVVKDIKQSTKDLQPEEWTITDHSHSCDSVTDHVSEPSTSAECNSPNKPKLEPYSSDIVEVIDISGDDDYQGEDGSEIEINDHQGEDGSKIEINDDQGEDGIKIEINDDRGENGSEIEIDDDNDQEKNGSKKETIDSNWTWDNSYDTISENCCSTSHPVVINLREDSCADSYDTEDPVIVEKTCEDDVPVSDNDDSGITSANDNTLADISGEIMNKRNKPEVTTPIKSSVSPKKFSLKPKQLHQASIAEYLQGGTFTILRCKGTKNFLKRSAARNDQLLPLKHRKIAQENKS